MATKHRRTRPRTRRQHHRGRRPDRGAPAGSSVAVDLDELLLDCLGGIDPEEVGRLIEAAATMTPDEVLGMVLAAAEEILPSITSSLEAEMWGSELLGELQLMGLEAEAVDETVGAEIVPMLEEAANPPALALLVVLSSLGGPESSAAARAARQRLATAGLSEPAWAADLGMPKIGRSWVHRDIFGEQESIFTTFRYGRSEHVISVLIDHQLGGGVKDAYATTQVRKLRRQLDELASDDPITIIEEIEAAEAASKLQEALAAQPCPWAADQVRDSTLFGALLRSRVRHLTTSVTTSNGSASDCSGAGSAGADAIWQIKVTLNGTKPPIWRRLEVPGDLSLAALHQVLQGAFGWWDSHMHVFETPVGSFGVPDRELGFADERSATLRDVAPRPGDRFVYTYDFGDDWEHVIVVEKLVAASAAVHYPRCTGGRRACPPEDCGGVWGYAAMLDAVRDPGNEDHEETTSWLAEMAPAGFDPAKFDANEANSRLANSRLASVRR